MPLLIDGEVFKDQFESITDLVKKFPRLKEASVALLNKSLKTFSNSEKLLYVHQREYAVTNCEDKFVEILGSDDATTCHIIAIRHSGSGATALGHFDGNATSQGVHDMVRAVVKLSNSSTSGRIEVYLMGGFIDDRGLSASLTREAFSELQKSDEDLHLVVACCTELNDRIVRSNVHGPLLYGLAINVRTGDVFPAQFNDKGPDRALRSARSFCGDKQMYNWYDHTIGLLMIGPFHYRPFEDAHVLLRFPDPLLLKYTSTSPQVEPPYYAQATRETLQLFMKYPDCAVHFPESKSRNYYLDGVTWKRHTL